MIFLYKLKEIFLTSFVFFHRKAKKPLSQQKKLKAKPKGLKEIHYDMDDYELLLARHQLIQQQLQKVKGNNFLNHLCF